MPKNINESLIGHLDQHMENIHSSKLVQRGKKLGLRMRDART